MPTPYPTPHLMLVAGLAALALFGCSVPAPVASFDSPDPAERARAATAAAGDRSEASTLRLIELLDSDDPALRMIAIRALEDRTGETFGYRHQDPPLKRRAAVDRWMQWAAGARSE